MIVSTEELLTRSILDLTPSIPEKVQHSGLKSFQKFLFFEINTQLKTNKKIKVSCKSADL